MGTSIPPNGMAAATWALRYWERRQEVVANNLANVSTDGFKGERAFARVLEGRLPEIETRTDFRAGSLRQTDNPLDVALRGDGFLVVETPQGERYARGGALRLDTDRTLVDQNGNRVLGEDGPIRIPTDVVAIEIDRSGAVLGQVSTDPFGVPDGARPVFGRLRLETVPAGTTIPHEGDTYWRPPETRTVLAPEARDVRQGYLEESNVGTTDALIEMITIQRHFAFAQKAITTLDEIRGTAVNDLGKPV
jgi:flagellar basal body rod protein FlgG